MCLPAAFTNENGKISGAYRGSLQYDDDTPSVYDNPYYNDNLDMDQQSIEFWNSI